jgi:hypothetical protein
MNTVTRFRRTLAASVLGLSILTTGVLTLGHDHDAAGHVQVVANRNGHS